MNERITKQVLSALEHDRRVDLHRDRVEVGFDDGVATLSGEVSSIAAKPESYTGRYLKDVLKRPV